MEWAGPGGRTGYIAKQSLIQVYDVRSVGGGPG